MAGITSETRDAVTDLLVRYATGIDTRDWTLLRSCFTDDCDADYGDIGRWRNGDEITQWMAETHGPLGPSLHRLSNFSFSRAGEWVVARCYVHVVIVLDRDHASTLHAYGYYDDEIVLTEDGPKVARRTFTPVPSGSVSG